MKVALVIGCVDVRIIVDRSMEMGDMFFFKFIVKVNYLVGRG